MLPDASIFSHVSGWIGAGGISLILVAFLAYATKRLDLRKADKQPEQAVAIQSIFAEHFANERLNTEIAALRGAIEELSHNINRFCDRIDMVQVWNQFNKSKDR